MFSDWDLKDKSSNEILEMGLKMPYMQITPLVDLTSNDTWLNGWTVSDMRND